MAETSATAEGDIARTPFAHLLVYAYDHALSGAVFLAQPDGVEHVVRFVRGAPVKVRPGDRHALFGEMLVEAGAIDAVTLEAALATKGLLGDMLLVSGCVERDVLERVAEQQLVRRIVRFFELPPEATYRYFDGHDALAEYGGDPVCVDPLSLIWSGLSVHAERSAMMETTLAAFGDKPMKLHPSATASRFGLEGGEAKLLDHLQAQAATVAELLALGVAPPEAVRRFAYAMLITRQLDAGTGSAPLGAPDSARPSSVSGVVSPPNAPTAFARMQLKSTVHRLGAAAPDLPGAGERDAPITRVGGRRSRPIDPRAESDPDRASNEPPSSRERLSGESTPSTARSSSSSSPEPSSSTKDLPGVEPARDSGVIPVQAPSATGSRDRQGADREAPARREPAPYVPGSTLRSQKAPVLSPEDAGIESSQLSAGKSVEELVDIARNRLAARDAKGALVACDEARAAAPADADVIALGVWIRLQLGSADLKALEVELDELLAGDSGHVTARFYRAIVRKRLGNHPSCMNDLRHVLELDPGHADAKRELGAMEPKPVAKPDRPSLFGRLFKR